MQHSLTEPTIGSPVEAATLLRLATKVLLLAVVAFMVTIRVPSCCYPTAIFEAPPSCYLRATAIVKLLAMQTPMGSLSRKA